MPKYTITTTDTKVMPVARALDILRARYPIIPPYARRLGAHTTPSATGSTFQLVALLVEWVDTTGADHCVEFTLEEAAELLAIDGFPLTADTRVGTGQLATVHCATRRSDLEPRT